MGLSVKEALVGLCGRRELPRLGPNDGYSKGLMSNSPDNHKTNPRLPEVNVFEWGSVRLRVHCSFIRFESSSNFNKSNSMKSLLGLLSVEIKSEIFMGINGSSLSIGKEHS